MSKADQTAPQTASFDAYILFSEAIQFGTDEIEAALREDYPTLDIGATGVPMTAACDTAEFITQPLFFGASGKDAPQVTTLIRLPGFGTWDPAQVRPTARLRCPDLDAALAGNASYICVSVSARGSDMASAFRAARTCSCLAAVFAKLPVALAVYWEQGDHFLSTQNVIAMADTAMNDDWPVADWIGADVQAGSGERDGHSNWCRGWAKGLHPFRGFDLTMSPAPLAPEDGYQMMMATCTLTLAYGNEFKDGDTFSVEGGGPVWRFRLLPEGVEGADRDYMMLIHPDSPVNAEEMLGETQSTPAPKGVDNTERGNPGFFKRLLRGRRDN